MPYFFIDTDNGHKAIVDEEGYELADPQAARDLAVRALSELTQDGFDVSDRRLLSARVRAADGSAVYAAALVFTGEWLIDRPGS